VQGYDLPPSGAFVLGNPDLLYSVPCKLNVAHRAFKMGGACMAGLRQSSNGARQVSGRQGK
jgi:hypothetical protein